MLYNITRGFVLGVCAMIIVGYGVSKIEENKSNLTIKTYCPAPTQMFSVSWINEDQSDYEIVASGTLQAWTKTEMTVYVKHGTLCISLYNSVTRELKYQIINHTGESEVVFCDY